MPEEGPLDDSHVSIAQRRPRREIKIPSKYPDVLPQAQPALPPIIEPIISTPPAPPPTSLPEPQPTRPESVTQRECRVFKTTSNVFGLFRQYHAENLPTHDPEEYVHLEDLCNEIIPADSSPQPDISTPHATPFYPYPNSSSLRLGDWYWNHGAQKTQADFKELMHIVGDPEFLSANVRNTKWDVINKVLGSDEVDEEWLDEDAGWLKDSVTINVPFHQRMAHPGIQSYTIPDFYHRSIVAILKEKLSDPVHHQHFHYEPYKLYWEPRGDGHPVRVHGEMYSSDAFIEAHRELQDSPPEPGCDLPRVVAGLMFWSDSTHLASFSDAKLWPLYMYCGNDSKYRRCKPTCNLCSHVAYFHKVTDISHHDDI